LEKLKKFDVIYKKTKSFGWTVRANSREEALVVCENLKDRRYIEMDNEDSDWNHDAMTELVSVTEKA